MYNLAANDFKKFVFQVQMLPKTLWTHSLPIREDKYQVF